MADDLERLLAGDGGARCLLDVGGVAWFQRVHRPHPLIAVIPGCADRRRPGIHCTTNSVEKWIPGSLALLAPRNDAFLIILKTLECPGTRACRHARACAPIRRNGAGWEKPCPD